MHIKKLNQALRHGLKLKKLQRATEFQYSKWMKPYIYLMLSTRLRTSVKNEFRKNFKLMNNNVFGKTMEKISNHKDMKLVTSK